MVEVRDHLSPPQTALNHATLSTSKCALQFPISPHHAKATLPDRQETFFSGNCRQMVSTIGAYGGANVSQMSSEIALKTPSNGSQSASDGQMAVNRRLRGCKCQSDDSEIALKTPPHGSQSAVKRQSIGAYGGANVSQMTAKSRSKRQWQRQSIGSQTALTGIANVSQMTAIALTLTSPHGSHSQSTGSSKSLRIIPQHGQCSESKSAYMGSQKYAQNLPCITAVSRQANGSQSALTGVQMSVRRQRNRAQNVVNGSQSAVNRQSIGAYGGANVSQMTAKSRSKRRHMAVSRQQMAVNRRLRGANVSQTTAKSHSSRN